MKKILIVSSDKKLKEVLKFCFDGWGYEIFLENSGFKDLTPIKKISPDVVVADVHSASKEALEICRILKDDFITAFIPIVALIDKRQLRDQLLEIKQGIDDYLIKPPDPLDLRVRIEMAIKRSQYSFYSSPLTGLPSGRIIEETLKSKIDNSENFAFGYIDIDNFKYFNDAYGYLKGDRVIMQTAYILYTVIKESGRKNDFIGHIGGDDFVFITSIDKYIAVSEKFISLFDRLIPFHYSDPDRSNGYITARDRTHKIKNIPLMSASLALVLKDGSSVIGNIIEINEKVCEIKRYLKTLAGSKFMSDRRNRKERLSGPNIHKKGDRSKDACKPLGQILLEKGELSQDQLNEGLLVHWKRGIVLGEVLKELGFITEDNLNEALKDGDLYKR
ncbi:MAG: diguanylate cyclase [Candidatus Omnitrophota bacterium]|jgi:GGDEF domain-containing protein|nr:diguanylate cyclase [Candidatus Omnitrophota bacterium]